MSIATLKTVPNIGAVTGARCLSFATPALTSFATGAQAIAAIMMNGMLLIIIAFITGSVSELPEAPNATENADFIAEKSSK